MREEISISDAFIDLGEVQPGTTRSPWRPSAAVAVAVALVLIVAATAIGGVGRSNRDRASLTVAPRPTLTEPADDGFISSELPPVTPVKASFVDANRGYLVLLRCPTGAAAECTADLAATADGGQTWSPRTLPTDLNGIEVAMSGFFALGGDVLVLDRAEGFYGPEVEPMPSVGPDGQTVVDPTMAPSYRPAKRWVSPDGGRTWREVPRGAQGTVGAVPPDAALFYPDPGMFARISAGGDQTSVLQGMTSSAEVLRPDGTSMKLKSAPSGGLFTSVTQASDGSIWVAGFADVPDSPAIGGEASPGALVVEVSRDRGRTWRKVAVPGGTSTGQFATIDGRTLGVLDLGVAHAEEDGTYAIARLIYSHDAGATWASLDVGGEVSGGSAGGSPGLSGYYGVPVSFAPLADGSLLVAEAGILRRLEPDSRSLQPIETNADIAAVQPAGQSVLGAGREPSTCYVSTDGQHWIRLNLA